MAWVLIGALGVYIARDFGLTPGQTSLLVAIPLLGGALVRIPIGVLTDRIGPKKTGAMAQCIVVLPLLWGWRFGHDLPQLMALGLLLSHLLPRSVGALQGDGRQLHRPLCLRRQPVPASGQCPGRSLRGGPHAVRMLKVLFGVVRVLLLGVAWLPPLALVTVLLFLAVSGLGMGNDAVFQLVPQPGRC